MKDVYWDYVKDSPTSWRGTGGGKTVTLMSIIYALLKSRLYRYLWSKNSDLASLKKLPVFHGRVYSSKEDIINCFRKCRVYEESATRSVTSFPDYRPGTYYTHYNLKPKFLLVRWMGYALVAKIDRDYSQQSELMEYLTQIVLEGRQAGVYVIFAMQRPDGEYIKTSLRTTLWCVFPSVIWNQQDMTWCLEMQ